jgi:S-adenosylmethionine hydrolase
MERPITLTTDFGYRDPFAGIMKGVILRICPAARIIDLSHGVPPQDIWAAALILRSSVPYFPQGTIHVAVVDPEVGSPRKALLMEADGSFFVGPDNGVFSLALEQKPVQAIFELSNERYHLNPTSRTFHGRDIFAPVAAHLAAGVPGDEFGPRVTSFHRLRWPQAKRLANSIEGEIVYVDGFGNLITNIAEKEVLGLGKKELTVAFAGNTIRGLAPTYSSKADSNYIALINSWGLLEIALFKASATQRSGARVGDRVRLDAGPGEPHGS